MKRKIICTMLSFVLCLGVTVGVKPTKTIANAASGTVTLSRSSMVDKIEGGFMGALWANFAGLPSEFQYIASPGSEDSFKWVLSDVYVTDDDTSMEYTFLHMMEVYGVNDITYKDMVAEWIYHFQDYIWEGNYYARQLMLQGKLPPETGKTGFNKTSEAIDAQIECEIFGMVTPGMPQNAYGRTKYWMAVVGDGVVLENAAFYAMLCANAFVYDDVYQNMEDVRSRFADDSTTAEIYDTVKHLYETYPDDWRTARAAMHSRYYTGYNLDCRINFASTIMALLYGGGDYEKTVKIGVLAGYDNDCNAATSATIVGLTLGYDKLPQQLKEQSGTYYRNTNRPGLYSSDVHDIAERIANQAEKVILSAGGVKNGNNYIIYDKEFTPNNYDDGYLRAVAATDSAWTYSGMSKFNNSGFKSGKGYGTTQKDAYAEVTFIGDVVEIVSTTSVNGGSFAVTLDGQDKGVVSLKAEETFTVGKFVSMSYGQTILKLRGLGEGTHTLRLTSLEEGKWHAIDYVKVSCSEEEYYAESGLNYARTAAATPIASVTAALGSGAGGGGIGVICDGTYYNDGDHSSSQYDSYLGRQPDGTNYPKDYEDYVGYSFSRTFTVSKVVFNEGGHWGTDGGWFENGEVRIEVLIDGVWTEVQSDVVPVYPNNPQSVASGRTYVFTFKAIKADGIRVIGTPGGTCKIISCGELEVYGE